MVESVGRDGIFSRGCWVESSGKRERSELRDPKSREGGQVEEIFFDDDDDDDDDERYVAIVVSANMEQTQFSWAHESGFVREKTQETNQARKPGQTGDGRGRFIQRSVCNFATLFDLRRAEKTRRRALPRRAVDAEPKEQEDATVRVRAVKAPGCAFVPRRDGKKRHSASLARGTLETVRVENRPGVFNSSLRQPVQQEPIHKRGEQEPNHSHVSREELENRFFFAIIVV